MFYAGGYNNDPQHIGVAVSENDAEWTRPGTSFHYEWSRRSMEPPNQTSWRFLDKDGQTGSFSKATQPGARIGSSRVKINWETNAQCRSTFLRWGRVRRITNDENDHCSLLIRLKAFSGETVASSGRKSNFRTSLGYCSFVCNSVPNCSAVLQIEEPSTETPAIRLSRNEKNIPPCYNVPQCRSGSDRAREVVSTYRSSWRR